MVPTDRAAPHVAGATYVEKVTGGKAVQTTVTVGISAGGETQITSGLASGDQVQVPG